MEPIDRSLRAGSAGIAVPKLRPGSLLGQFEDGDHYFETPSFSYLGKGVLNAKEISQKDLRNGSFAIEDLIGPDTNRAFVELPFDREAPAKVITPAQEVFTFKALECPGGPVELLDDPVARAIYGSNPSNARLLESLTLEIAEDQEEASWLKCVSQAVSQINERRIDKVVLAKTVTLKAESTISEQRVLTNLSGSFPGSYLFAFEGLIGASPELLLSCESSQVRSRPLAGTVGRFAESGEDETAIKDLLSAESFSHEHLIVRDYVAGILEDHLEDFSFSDEPYVLTLPNVHHLASEVWGTLKPGGPSALQLAAMLHPTPAVCGWPVDDAYRMIHELEGWDRGTYGGAVGCIDRMGNGWFAVAIRCAKIDGRQARAYVGNGIVGTSDPGSELAETRFKLSGVVSSIVGALAP